MAQGALGDPMVVGPLVILQGLFQIRRAVEPVAAQDLRYAAIEALHRAVGLRAPGRNQSMLDVRRRALTIKDPLCQDRCRPTDMGF